MFFPSRTPKYAQALRVIGQSLEEIRVKSFDIKSEGKGYVIQGHGEAPEPVELKYDAADIEHVDRQRQKMRSSSSGMPDFSSLPQLLRAVGYYLEHKEGRLLGISTQEGAPPLFTLQYARGQHRLKVEFHLASDLYDLCVRMYKQRNN